MAINLTSEQKYQLNVTSKDGGQQCLYDFLTDPYPSSGLHCNSSFDSIYCWPTAPANRVISVPCFEVIQGLTDELKHIPAHAYRVCDGDGQWLWGNWTNYTECLNLLDMATGNAGSPTHFIVTLVAYTSFFGSLVSFVLLTVTMFIFCYFKSLQCYRLSVHKHLVAALLVRFALMVVIAEPLVSQRTSGTYRQLDWLCKAILCIELWATMSSISWMFLEGLYLHSRITVSIFDDRAPFLLFYSIGWGLPFCFVSAWAVVMHSLHPVHCWHQYGNLPHTWILAAPITVALIVNLLFLVNILRILVTRLRAHQKMEAAQIRKTIKATIVLFPLLGIPNLLFFLNPGDGGTLEDVYMMTNAILQSSQGISVSVLYCFLNIEVRSAIYKKYVRKMMRRNPNSKRFKSQKSFRTTSVYVSQTECCSTNDNNLLDVQPSAVRTRSIRELSLPQRSIGYLRSKRKTSDDTFV